MAPPAIQSYTDSPTMTVGTGFLSLSQSSVTSSSFPKASLSPSDTAYSIHADHDYIIKPVKVGPETRIEPEPITDAMLSSSAPLDFEAIMNDIDFTDDLADLNFSLTDLEPNEDFPMEESFQDFIDSALDQSFCSLQQWEAEEKCAQERVMKEDFMRALGLQPSETTNKDQENHFRDKPIFSFDSNNNISSSNTSTNVAVSQQSSPLFSPLPKDGTAIPTKQCTYSQHCVGPRAVYTQAGQKSPNMLTTSSSSQFPIPPHSPSSFRNNSSNNNNGAFQSNSRSVIGPCLSCIQNRDVLKEFSKPLTIDVNCGVNDSSTIALGLHGLHQQMDMALRVHPVEQRPPLPAQDKDEDDLLRWLNASEPPTVECHQPPDTPTVPRGPAENVKIVSTSVTQNLEDLESYMDLEELLDEKVSASSVPSQPTVQHDHTYQKITTPEESVPPMSDREQQAQLRLSFLDKETTQHSDLIKDSAMECQSHQDLHIERFPSKNLSDFNDSTLSLMIPSPVSPLSSSSPYPSPDSTAQFPHQDTHPIFESEKNQLDILNFFSDDLSSSLLSAGSPVTHFRFM